MTTQRKYAVAFSLVAGFCFAGAVGIGGYALVLFWPTASFGWVVWAYATEWPGVFGTSIHESPDGFNRLVTLPYRLLLYGAWQLQGQLTSEADCHRITDNLYLGRYPREVPDDVDVIVDFTCEFGRPPCVGSCDYYCLPTLDGCAPPREKFRQLVEKWSRSDRTIYAHCASGHGRSSLFAAALLLRRGVADDLAEVEQMIQSKRPGIGWSAAQRNLLVEMFGGE